MKPTKTILIGAPLLGEEARFLKKLRDDLVDTEALILANFFAKDRQFDFVVITPSYAAIIELKNFPRPIFGQQNGVWKYLDFAGNQTPYSGGNPWQQTLSQKYALSDEMKVYQASNRAVPSASGKGFYSEFDAFVCIFPTIHPESKVTKGDHKVAVCSYADVVEILRSRSKQSSWNQAEWRRFAEDHLKLTPVTLEEATDPKIREAREKISSYNGRIKAVLEFQLSPLLPDSEDPNCGQRLINNILEPENFLLIGASGSAKTFHLHHLSLAIAAGEEEVPLLVEAGKYRGGDFWSLLRQATAPLFRGDPREILEAVRLCGLRPVLMIDALNECSGAYLPDLIRHAQAFVLHFGARIIFTSQSKIELPDDLKATIKELSLPDTAQKRLIYCFHAGLVAAPDIDIFCSGFTNAYDLTIAGRCHGSSAAPKSRADLYDRYVRRCLPKHAAVSSAIFRKVAGKMGNAIATVWNRDDFERVAELCIREQQASLTVLDELRHSRLIALTDEFFSFEHECLLDYFRAEDLRRRVGDIKELAAELKRPRNQGLMEFILPRFSDQADIGAILSTTNEVSLLCRVLSGQCGARARSVLAEQCHQLLDAAERDLPKVEIVCKTIQTENGRRRLADLELQGNREWTVYDSLLCHVIALHLDHPDLKEKFLKLLDLTEWRLRAIIRSAARSSGFKLADLWGETVRLYGGTLKHGTLRLPCAAILSMIRTALMIDRRYAEGLPICEELLERTRRSPESHFSLLALLHDRRAACEAGRVTANLALIRQAWNSGIYILRLDALDLLQWMRSSVEEVCPQELPKIREMLEGFETENIIENSVRLETLALCGGLEPPVSVKDALSEMKAVIVPGAADDPAMIQLAALSEISPTQCLADEAYGCLGKVFEDVFQGAYWQAYSELTSEEKCDILCLAARASESGFHLSWILQELLKCGGRRALPIYLHYASRVNDANFCTQEAVGAFVLCIQGCARWSDTPPPYRNADSPEHQAWQITGEILFSLFRDNEAGNGRQKIEELWERFDGPALTAAADVLYQIIHARWQIGERDRIVDLVRSFPGQVRSILERCIEQRETLPSVFQFGGSHDRNVIRFLIESLGEVGDETTIPKLRTIVDDTEFGKAAVQAIESIQRATLHSRTLRTQTCAEVVEVS